MSCANTTTYVLGGGFMKKTQDEGYAFYRAVIGDRKAANVLICCFAMSRDQWQTGYSEDRNMILSTNTGASLSFQNASLENFEDQLAWANVIVFRGGSINNLMDNLNKVRIRQKNLSGKTIVGSSAGAYMLSSSYLVTDRTPQLAPGLGLLPIVIASHYRSTFIHDGDMNKSQAFWDDVDHLMRAQANGRDAITLKEGAFITLSREYS